jgi:hypothetical protein
MQGEDPQQMVVQYEVDWAEIKPSGVVVKVVKYGASFTGKWQELS